MGAFTNKMTTVTGYDGAGSPISKTIGPGAGNLTHGEVQAGCVETTPLYNRGTYVESTEGQQQAIDFSIEIWQDGKVTGASGATASPADLVMKKGDFVAATTTDPGLVVHHFTVIAVLTRSGVTSTLTLTNCRGKFTWGEDAAANKISISGTAYGTGSVLPLVWS